MLTFPTDPKHIANQIDLADLAERVRAGGQRLRVMDARREARSSFERGNKASALFFLCNEADDSITLRRVGRRGSCRVVWNYGSIIRSVG